MAVQPTPLLKDITPITFPNLVCTEWQTKSVACIPCLPQIQIGCQTDYLSADVLKRAPCVYERYPITTESTTVWNLWGGLIYLLAPPQTQVEGAEVNVQMAVLAPYYKSGESLAGETVACVR